MVKNLPAMQGTQVQFLGREDPLEKEMATHSSTIAWEIPWTEEPGGLQLWGCKRVGHDLMAKQQASITGKTATFFKDVLAVSHIVLSCSVASSSLCLFGL